MNFKVIPTKAFMKAVEYYVKKKRYVHIADDIRTVTDELENGKLIGDEIPNLKIEANG
jgi:hypothetical protein